MECGDMNGLHDGKKYEWKNRINKINKMKS